MVTVVVVLTAIVFFGSYWLGYSTASLLIGWEWFRKLCGFVLFVVIGRSWVRDAIPYLASQMVFYVPTAHFAVQILFGERRRGYLLEGGPYFKWPDFMERTEHVSLELESIPITTSFVTYDQQGIEIEGSLQSLPDPEVVNEHGQVIYLGMSENVIASGIGDRIKEKLGGIGGIQTGEDLIRRRQSFIEVINHFLRTKTPIHLRHPKDCKMGIQAGDVFIPCEWLGIEEIDVKDIPDFYTAHWRDAKKETDAEKQAAEERSSIELLYGIDIEKFVLSEIRFSQKTMKAFEMLEQAKAREKANERLMQMADHLKAVGEDVSSETAINVAQAMLDPDIAKNRRTVSFEGLGQGATPVVVLGDLGGGQGGDGEGHEKTPTANTEKKSKKGGRK